MHSDPESSVVKLSNYLELIVRWLCRHERLQQGYRSSVYDLISDDTFQSIIPKPISMKMDALRIHGNRAAHGDPVKAEDAQWLLKEAKDSSEVENIFTTHDELYHSKQGSVLLTITSIERAKGDWESWLLFILEAVLETSQEATALMGEIKVQMQVILAEFPAFYPGQQQSAQVWRVLHPQNCFRYGISRFYGFEAFVPAGAGSTLLLFWPP